MKQNSPDSVNKMTTYIKPNSFVINIQQYKAQLATALLTLSINFGSCMGPYIDCGCYAVKMANRLRQKTLVDLVCAVCISSNNEPINPHLQLLLILNKGQQSTVTVFPICNVTAEMPKGSVQHPGWLQVGRVHQVVATFWMKP